MKRRPEPATRSHVIVGAWQYDSGQIDEGAAFVFLGSAAGIADGNPGGAAAHLESNQAGAGLRDQGTVEGAGDVNGDGFDDVIIGVSRYDGDQTDEGAAFILLGSSVAPPVGGELGPGDYGRSFGYKGWVRSYFLHVPLGYGGTTPVPLVLDFHGFGSDANAQRNWSGYSQVSDVEGFLVAHPQGVGESWNIGSCCGDAQIHNVDDVAPARLPRRGLLRRHRTCRQRSALRRCFRRRFCRMRELNGCQGTSPDTTVVGAAGGRCETYNRCLDGVEMALCSVFGDDFAGTELESAAGHIMTTASILPGGLVLSLEVRAQPGPRARARARDPVASADGPCRARTLWGRQARLSPAVGGTERAVFLGNE